MSHNAPQTDNCSREPVYPEAPVPQTLSSPASSKERRPGELVFTLLVFAFGALACYFATGLSSDNYSAPSVFPKAASVVIMGGSLISLIKAIKLSPATRCTAWAYLMPHTVPGMLVFILLYCIALPFLHFVASSYIFLVASLTFLYRGRKFLRMCLYSAASLTCLVLIFRYVMLVILP